MSRGNRGDFFNTYLLCDYFSKIKSWDDIVLVKWMSQSRLDIALSVFE